MPRINHPSHSQTSARADPYANEANLRLSAAAALAMTDGTTSDDNIAEAESPATPPDAATDHPFRFLDLPPELRLRIYNLVGPEISKVVLKPSGSLVSAAAHPLERASRQVRGEFLSEVEKFHGACTIVYVARDFDFGRLIRNLRAKGMGRLTVPNLHIIVRHDIRSPTIDTERLTKWCKFVKTHRLRAKHVVVGLPAVAQRRAFFSSLWDFGKGVEEVLPEIAEVLRGFVKQWDKGRGEMQWAREEEKDPMERAGSALKR